ncbi:MAG: metal-sensing transcriptional repressor [Amnibacterium sp.]
MKLAPSADLKRLRRIECRARALQRMVDGEKYRIGIPTRVPAMTSALHSSAPIRRARRSEHPT